ncbi:winged helix-turn-helix transcriptional regulator [Streptomyces sp. NPDC086080]|uniref:winged helix-turn-helix transcriptional regulator n=1 Tax=Streptomyces sp. NPDC086080 TaxID=3365748 RepID=UPI0037D7051D
MPGRPCWSCWRRRSDCRPSARLPGRAGQLLWALHEHPHRRFGELRRLLPGITEKVLASHLRELEADRVVRRVSYDEVPPRVEYSLTEDGKRLNDALEPLAAWGRERPNG